MITSTFKTKKIINVVNPVNDQDAATKKYCVDNFNLYTDADARAAIGDIYGSDGKADADIDMDNHQLINVYLPNDGTDAANK